MIKAQQNLLFYVSDNSFYHYENRRWRSLNIMECNNFRFWFYPKGFKFKLKKGISVTTSWEILIYIIDKL